MIKFQLHAGIYNKIEIKLQTYLMKLKHDEIKRENLQNYIIDFPIILYIFTKYSIISINMVITYQS